MKHWHIMQNQSGLAGIFKHAGLGFVVTYKKDILVRAKIPSMEPSITTTQWRSQFFIHSAEFPNQ